MTRNNLLLAGGTLWCYVVIHIPLAVKIIKSGDASAQWKRFWPTEATLLVAILVFWLSVAILRLRDRIVVSERDFRRARSGQGEGKNPGRDIVDRNDQSGSSNGSENG